MAPEEIVGEPGRLDAVLARLTGVARAEVQRAISAGFVTVDGHQASKSHKLLGGEVLLMALPEATALAPEGPAVPIRYEDEDLAVVAKPAGIATHPTRGRRTGTLVNRLLGAGIAMAPAGGPLRPGIVHRLDVGTSGLMIVAKTDRAYEALAKMMKSHSVRRRYLALVHGRVTGDGFKVDAPLGRRAARIVVDHAEGRQAETTFEVVERMPRSTLLEATPMTGRTHQIRVHLSAVGHPVLGDRAYGGGGDQARALGLNRPFLHSYRIGFVHPLTGQTIEIEEPLPPDLDKALRSARTEQRP